MSNCTWTGTGGAKKRTRRGRTKRRSYRKGSPSKTHSGQDFRTRKGSKFYNRRGHRQRFSQSGLRDTPFGKLLMAGSDRRPSSRRTKRRTKRRSKRSSGFKASRCFSF